GQRARIALGRHERGQARLAGPAQRVVEHLPLQVEDLEPPVRSEPLRHRQRVVARARADLEQPLARPRRRRLDPEALAVRAGRRIAPPPQGGGGDGSEGDEHGLAHVGRLYPMGVFLDGLKNTFLMAYEVWWALVLGFAISAIVQAWVPRDRIERRLAGSGPKPVSLATLLGAA